ncbi:MAG: DUF1186 domain-containing protein [Desulfobacteraceae bacterium]|nr:DUF1186 domain-containing protein [Desulfobacteraceae bacterium]
MELQDILEELKYNKGYFPHEAVTEAIINRESVIPDLLKIIEYSTDNIDSLADEDGYFAHIFAMYLLAQFKEKRAFKPLINFFSVPGEIAINFTGDVVTEDMGRIFASVFDGDTELLKSLIENENADEYIRAAAMSAFVALVANGKMPREETLNYFKELFNSEKLSRKPSHVWSALIDRCTDLYPDEVYEEIKEVFYKDLPDPHFIHLKDVKETLNKGKEKTVDELLENYRYSLIEDTVRELEHWACFRQNKYRPSSYQNPTVGTGKKTGRNKPCPCGSGKKYKKCCLNKTGV